MICASLRPRPTRFWPGVGCRSKPRHGILATSGNVSRLERAGKNPRLGALLFSPTRWLYTTDCSVLTLVAPGGRQAEAGGLPGDGFYAIIRSKSHSCWVGPGPRCAPR